MIYHGKKQIPAALPKRNKAYVEQVYELVRLCPPGRVTTYGAIADALTLGSARMVGFALRQSIGQDDIPAHRVVNSQGRLSGKLMFAHPTAMEEALRSEGVEVVNDQVCEFRTRFWHPAEE